MKIDFWILAIKDSKRRENILKNFSTAPFKINVFDAVDARKLSQDQLKALINEHEIYQNMGRELVPAEIGCAISHLKLYEKFISSDSDLLVVFEDDAYLLESNIDILCKNFFESRSCKPCVLSFFSGDSYGIKTNLDGVLRCLTAPTHGVGYAINKTAAKKIIEKTKGKVISTADWPSVADIEYFVTTKPMVEHRNIASNIENTRSKLKAPKVSEMLKLFLKMDFQLSKLFINSLWRFSLKVFAKISPLVKKISHKDTNIV